MNDRKPTRKERREGLIKSAKRIVVKVGSGVLTGEGYQDVDETVVAEIARQVAIIKKAGRRVAVVSSGSVVLGSKILKLRRHGLTIPEKQASAAIGQGGLTSLWARHLGAQGLKAGQILLTHDDMSHRRRFLNARSAINTLLDFDVIPVINENDTVAVHELKFGDNDTLSARVTNLLEADLLVILSDVDGLYSADPRIDKTGVKIDYVEVVDDKILEIAKDSSSATGLGGMASKVKAAAEAAKFGAATIVLSGAQRGALESALKGEDVGTFFFPHEDRMKSKKHWIVFHLKSQGRVMVDEGAQKALTHGGRSLLASGISRVEGAFESGAAIYLVGEDGSEFAKGLVKYHSHELEKIKGQKSDKIDKILGYKPSNEVMHRDDMVLIEGIGDIMKYESDVSSDLKSRIR
ncbi:Glutamate 5-kinase / RNA-binding C-terminal domain PUA [hydrothermal vent metagenome]|uniref:Glutamate 5-kinase / RNA-binding C-terminal domain PUA n=1 Tax=hydrothermal vent metagenome TaxID=652676 RepID=A0A3B1C365_9ZZZZ